MINEGSVFSFELNESLYFEKGQEVLEMRGISLDPEISIQPFNEYISIRGVIELQGEYVKESQREEREEEPLDFEAFQSKRFVERVTSVDDDTLEFTHRFPVEISVPTYRVEDLEEVRVYIESFDYELPQNDHLKLYSTVQIHGVNQLTEHAESRNNSEEQVDTEEPSIEEEKYHTFEFEIKPKNESVSEYDTVEERETPQLSGTSREEDIVKYEEENVEKESKEESIEEESKENRWKYKETKTLTQFFEDLSAKEDVSPNEQESSSSYLTDNSASLSDEMPSSSYEMESSGNRNVKDVSYLSDMFRNSEEEQYAKMQLCFVQENDTIETIAERYQITTLQLIKQNRLDDDYDVSEGQLLYIPQIKK